jgi:radical SAM superfamily enzyme YgiQ (UPF0313 family)
MCARPLTVVLVGASVLRETELPGFEAVSDFASESYNLAIASLKAFVLQAPDLADSVTVHLVDFEVPQGDSPLGEHHVDKVVALHPDVVGLSCYCWSVDALLELARRVHDWAPEVLIVAGGPSAGPDAPQLLSSHRAVRAVARDEGENVLISLLRSLRRGATLGEVPGLTWRDREGAIVENPDAEPVDLSDLPSPYRLGVLHPPRSSVLLETSRGCKFRCRFCSCMGGSRQLRYVPIDQVEADLRWAVDHGMTGVKLADTAINFHTERLQDLAAAIRRADPERRLRFTYFLKPELLTPDQVDVLEGIPSDEIIIGIESLTPAARKAAGKPPFSPEAFAEQVKGLQRIGPVTSSFILGLPGDTIEGLDHTMSWMTDFDRDHPGWLHVICLFWLAVLPGSGLHARRDALGFRWPPTGTPYALQSHEHDPDTLVRMARRSIEHHYAHPNLRVEHFHKEYLAQDAPAPDRTMVIPRRFADARPCVLLLGEVDDAWHSFGLEPYNLSIAWLKAFVEKDDALRRSFRVELATEKEDVSALLASLRPRWVVGSCLRPPLPSSSWLAAVLSETPRPSLLLEGARSPAEAQAWMHAIPQATAATVGEGEMALSALLHGLLDAPGLVRRDGDNLVSTGAPEVVEHLDDIPSPFQWGFVRRAGATIAMQLGRRSPPRWWGGERIYRDLRWAIEQRHDHVIWLDESLPADGQILRTFVDAVRRADPDGRVRHSFRLDGSLDRASFEVLSRLPVRKVTLAASLDPSWVREIERVASVWGGSVHEEAARAPTTERLLARLQPLRRPGALAGWSFVDAGVNDGVAEATFVWGPEATVKVRLAATGNAVRASVEPCGEAVPPKEQVARLRRAVTLLLERKRPRHSRH